MSIFGMLDAAKIPTNPNFVEKGDYSAELTTCEYRMKQDGQRQLFLQFTITEEDSAFKGAKVTKFFNLVDESMTLEDFKLLPPEEQQNISKSNALLKKTLCGYNGNEKHKGLGVDPEDLNDKNWDPKALQGTKVRLGIQNYGEDGVNLQWVNIEE